MVIAETLKMQFPPCSVRISVSSSAFHAGKMGSTPIPSTKNIVMRQLVLIVSVSKIQLSHSYVIKSRFKIEFGQEGTASVLFNPV